MISQHRLRSWRRPPPSAFLLLCNAKASNYRENKVFKGLAYYSKWPKVADAVIEAATNTIEGRVLQRLLDKLQEIRNALDDDAVFNVVGELLPAAQIERVLRDYYAGRLGDADLEDRLLRDVDEGRFRAICQNALEGLATKKLKTSLDLASGELRLIEVKG